jgi:translation initiation factor IF-2
MRASTMLEHEEKYAVILAFDVKVRRSNLIYGQDPDESKHHA